MGATLKGCTMHVFEWLWRSWRGRRRCLVITGLVGAIRVGLGLLRLLLLVFFFLLVLDVLLNLVRKYNFLAGVEFRRLAKKL